MRSKAFRDDRADVLIEAHHPAHLHFWKNTYSDLRREGRRIKILTRDRGIMKDLSAHLFGEDAIVLSKMTQKNRFPLSEFLERQFKVAQAVSRYRPKIVTSLMGVYSGSARLMRVPHLIFTDSEFQNTAHRIAHPFASKIFVPNCFDKNLGRHQIKTVSYPSYHELAYLHPNSFKADESIPRKYGLEPKTYFILRLSAWNTFHDRNLKGIEADLLRQTIEKLKQIGSVFLDQEETSSQLSEHRPPWRPEEYHQMIASSLGVITEGATTASEAAVLGVPALYVNRTYRGYLKEQEEVYGLVINCHDLSEFPIKLSQFLALCRTPEENLRKREKLLQEKEDLNRILVRELHRYLSEGFSELQ